MSKIVRVSAFVSKTFAVWALLAAILAFCFPAVFKVFAPFIPYLLGIVMFGMGITLTFADFYEVLKRPKGVAIGVVAQFVIMPSIAFVLAKVFALPAELAVGVILVGACPGGTSSNVMTYLARGNTALSVACTSVSTLLAPFLTPLIFYFLASHWIEINAQAMFVSVLKMVLLPIFLGLMVRFFMRGKGRMEEEVSQCMPLLSVVAIILILAAVVAVSKERIITSGLLIFTVVVLHNGLGYLLGFVVGRFFNLENYDCKAIAIEVGMQNSGLGAALANVHFDPIAAVPSALFSFWHNVSGSILANFLARLPNRRDGSDDV